MHQKDFPVEDVNVEKTEGSSAQGVLAYKKEDVSHLETLNLSEAEAEELAALEKSAKVDFAFHLHLSRRFHAHFIACSRSSPDMSSTFPASLVSLASFSAVSWLPTWQCDTFLTFSHTLDDTGVIGVALVSMTKDLGITNHVTQEVSIKLDKSMLS